jgi:hypothetical protein
MAVIKRIEYTRRVNGHCLHSAVFRDTSKTKTNTIPEYFERGRANVMQCGSGLCRDDYIRREFVKMF